TECEPTARGGRADFRPALYTPTDVRGARKSRRIRRIARSWSVRPTRAGSVVHPVGLGEHAAVRDVCPRPVRLLDLHAGGVQGDDPTADLAALEDPALPELVAQGATRRELRR